MHKILRVHMTDLTVGESEFYARAGRAPEDNDLRASTRVVHRGVE